METLIKADIFFFITSVSVILLTLFILIALYHLIKILKDVEFISDKFQKGTAFATDNLEELVKNINQSSIFKFIFGNKKTSSRKKKD